MKRTALFLTLVALCLFSCSPKENKGRAPVQFVADLIESGNATFESIGKYQACKDGAIYVMGEPMDCIVLQRELADCDSYDNVSGDSLSDRLPDFAGERICSVMDYSNYPYGQFLAAGMTDSLREQVVKIALLTMSDKCCLSPYDKEVKGMKSQAKLIVLSSSIISANGYFDIDTLFKSSGCQLKVVSPIHSALKNAAQRGCSTIGVLASEYKVSSGIYDDIVEEIAAETGKCLKCVPIAVPFGADALQEYLDDYISHGNTEPLDALVVDDYSRSVEEMHMTLERILSVMNEESLIYSDIISPLFQIYDLKTIASSECFRIMREDNLFTHNISYPKEISYMLVDRPVGVTGVGNRMLCEFNERYLNVSK